MDDDGIMMNVYDSMQDELKAKSDMLDRAKKKVFLVKHLVIMSCFS